MNHSMKHSAVLIGDNGSRFEVELEEASAPHTSSGLGGVWIAAAVSTEVYGFKAIVGTSFDSTEVSCWLTNLDALLKGGAQHANITSIEPCLCVDFEATTLGAFDFAGEIYSASPEGPTLEFGFQCDFVSLQRFCAELKRALRKCTDGVHLE